MRCAAPDDGQSAAHHHPHHTTLIRRDGRAVHVRKATRPEPHQQRIDEILGLSAKPGGTHRAVI